MKIEFHRKIHFTSREEIPLTLKCLHSDRKVEIIDHAEVTPLQQYERDSRKLEGEKGLTVSPADSGCLIKTDGTNYDVVNIAQALNTLAEQL